MPEYLNTPIIRDPVQRKLVNDREKALDEYVANSELYGEEDFRTQSKLILFVLRSYLVVIREQVQGIKEILIDFNQISDEIDGIFDLTDSNSSSRFRRGLEKYPRFLQNSIARRRAKKYYNRKVDDMKFMLKDVQDKLAIFPVFMQEFSKAVSGMSKGMGNVFSMDGKGKNKGLALSDDMRKAIEARKAQGGKGTSGGEQPQGTDGTTGGNAPQGGSGKPTGSDKWDD